MGVEQEFLRSYPAAILSYKKAVNFAEKNLGPDDGITQNLRSVFENAKVEVSKFWSVSYCFFMNIVEQFDVQEGRQRAKGTQVAWSWSTRRLIRADADSKKRHGEG